MDMLYCIVHYIPIYTGHRYINNCHIPLHANPRFDHHIRMGLLHMIQLTHLLCRKYHCESNHMVPLKTFPENPLSSFSGIHTVVDVNGKMSYCR